MAVENSGSTLTLPASGDLSGDQFKLIQVDSAGRAIIWFNPGNAPLGVLQNKPDAIDKPATIWGIGSVSKIVAGGIIAVGDFVGPHAVSLGKARVAVLDDYIIGTCLFSSGNLAINPHELILVATQVS